MSHTYELVNHKTKEILWIGQSSLNVRQDPMSFHLYTNTNSLGIDAIALFLAISLNHPLELVGEEFDKDPTDGYYRVLPTRNELGIVTGFEVDPEEIKEFEDCFEKIENKWRLKSL